MGRMLCFEELSPGFLPSKWPRTGPFARPGSGTWRLRGVQFVEDLRPESL